MVSNILDAVSAYKNSGKLTDAQPMAGASKAGGTEQFGSMLKGYLDGAVTSLHEGEKAAFAASTGKADLASVVTAIDNAEIVLTEITTIRDKVISAYQTITGSPI